MAKKRSDVSNLQLPPSLSRTVQTEGQLKEINHYVAAKKKKKHIPHNRHQGLEKSTLGGPP